MLQGEMKDWHVLRRSEQLPPMIGPLSYTKHLGRPDGSRNASAQPQAIAGVDAVPIPPANR
jgi:hypothetical protein